MTGLLDLTPRPPATIGIVKQNHIHASLHGDRLRRIREPSLSIFAPPRGSSSDEEFDGEEVPDDGFSDDSEFGRSEKKKGPDRNAMLRAGTDSSPANGKDDKKRELSVEPSNIRSGSFTSEKGPGTRNGSQSSQKRLKDETDDDMGPFGSIHSSQFKKAKMKTYGGPSNIQKGSLVEQKKPTKAATPEKRKERPPFRLPNAEPALASLARLQAEPKGAKRSTWKEIPSLQSSPRAQRASQRSVKSTQDSSQTSSKYYKQPLRLSPNKGPEIRASPVICEDVDDPPALRSSLPAKKPTLTTDANALKSSKIQNAFNTATDKLGISNMQISLPPSAACDSSAPPTPLDAATTLSSPLSSLDDSPLGSPKDGVPIITSEDMPIYTAKAQRAVCPMCKQPVDQSYLEGFTKVGTRMTLRQQAQFCKAHKERSAESEWAEREYPEIDWQQLDARIANLHPSMDDILSRRTFSFYRNAFEDSLKNGKNKTIHESLMRGDEIEGTLPGYYGGRGAKVMAENIMSRFASKLRRLAASDKLISSAGVSRYVQAVLVPELAVLLVMDDMKVDEEKAREVLRNSVEIGNLLNEEEDEIITDPAPEEREVVAIA